MAIASSAHADSTYIEPGTEGPATTPTPPAEREAAPVHWYGYQLLASDLVAGVCAGVGAGTPPWGGTAVEVFGIGLYAFGGTAIHGAHGHLVRALASPGLRIGMPIVGALLGMGFGAPRDEGGLGFLGAALGIIGAIVIDDIVLPFDQGAEPAATRVPVQRAAFAIAPTFAVVPDRERGTRTTLGVAGEF